MNFIVGDITNMGGLNISGSKNKERTANRERPGRKQAVMKEAKEMNIGEPAALYLQDIPQVFLSYYFMNKNLNGDFEQLIFISV